MARNSRRSRGMKKLQPAVQTLVYNYSVPANTLQNNTIDLSQCASLLNRRFYRQGLNWAVSSIKVLSSGSQTGIIGISKLPETWVMSNSWEKGFRAWQKMNDEALEESESVRPRFLDFKIYADATHHTAGFGGNLLPTADLVAAVPATPGEWEPSKVIIPRTDSTTGVPAPRELVAVGASYPGAGSSGLNAVSLIEGYASSRALPNVLDPNTPDDASDTSGVAPQNWMSALFNEGIEQTEEVLEDLQTENNIAPYPFENDGVSVDTMYPNGANQLVGLQIHDVDTITGTTVGGITRIKGGMFPCGLIRIDVQNTSADTSMGVNLLIELVPGTHRGYLAMPMTEM
jgi:hypothetical protein